MVGTFVLCRPMHQIIIFYKWPSENRFFSIKPSLGRKNAILGPFS